MNIMRILTGLVPLFLASSLAAGQSAGPSTPQAADASQSVMAVWVEKEVNFPYAGLTTHYSCTGIEGKVGAILRAIGARPGFKVQARGCVHDTGPASPLPGVEPMPWVYIRAALPRPATPELLAELAKPDSKGELAARTKGQKAAASEATTQFRARWEPVRFLATQLGPVQQGDCELVDQMAHDVFEQLGARIVENKMACVPRQVSPGSIRLTLEVLQPLPEKK
jgi:hypothetical protein